MLRPSYWIFPVISGLVWLGMLLGLLVYWCVDVRFRRYESMTGGQTIAYISDVGAAELKPLFVAGCVVTSLFLDLSFLSDRWLRHRGRLVPIMTVGQKVLSGLCILFAIVGSCGLILLSVFDTSNYKTLHDVFLLMFIAGFCLSAIFICWEYQRLGMHYREHRVLRISFWIKLIFVIVEIVLAIAFVACTFSKRYNGGAVLEWAIAFIFSFYVFSFYIDLYPAVRTRKTNALKKGAMGKRPVPEGERERQMEEAGGSEGRLTGQGGGRYGNGRLLNDF